MKNFYSLGARYGAVQIMLNSWMLGIRWEIGTYEITLYIRIGPLALRLSIPCFPSRTAE